MITVTIAKEGSTTITGAPVLGLSSSMLAAPLRAATPATTSSACVADVRIGDSIQTYTFVESYATVLAALTVDNAESGAELQSNKDATGGYAGLTLFKINFKNVANTFTSFFTNTNAAARTYTFQDRNGTIADDTDLALKEATANKATTFGTINDTKFPSVEAVVEVAQPIWYFAATGTDTYAATLTGIVPTAYYAGMEVKLLFGITNTGAATINLNALGAKDITKGTAGTTALSASDLVITKVYTLIYDGTRFQINL